ncbi:MAG: AAA family ATPase [Candidatus Nanopelagicales bacterium]|nr:AAA family ATPase [Candidatus Nanopelagicales bacterium]
MAKSRTGLPRIVAVVNQKGGVGKTTTAVNIAAALAEAGHQTLLIDLDPQANASLALGFNRGSGLTGYDCLIGDVPMSSIVRPTGTPTLSFVPSSVDLAASEIELVDVDGRERRLADSLDDYLSESGDLEFVVIDCPPSLGLLTVNALAAATDLVVPVQPEFYALDGLSQLTHTVGLVRQGLNARLRISLVCITMIDSRIAAQQHSADELRAHLGSLVARTTIPRDDGLSVAPGVGATALKMLPDSPGARAYRDLMIDLLDAVDSPALGSDSAGDNDSERRRSA